ncbi:hypothetical protein PMIN04_004616 [Paraphaeosphaeria minitans]
MSRENTPFSEAGRDGYLPVYQEDFGVRGEFYDGGDTPTFSSAFDQDALDGLGFGLQDGRIAPASSRTGSGTATPVGGHSPESDFGAYNFEQSHHGYPVLDDLDRGTTPYPPHLHTPHALYQKPIERPLPYRSGPNSNTSYAPSAVHNFNRTHPPHRRSWSQNDIERLPNLAPQPYPPGVRHQPPFPPRQNANPTFVRLCETRHSRPPTSRNSSDGKNTARYTHAQTRAEHNGRTGNPPTSMPVSIGMSLAPGAQNRAVPTSGNVQLIGPPKLVHMSHGEQRKTSQKIIEVGAMAVLSMTSANANASGKVENLDPRLLLMGYEGRAREKSGAPSPEAVEERGEPREKMLMELVKMEMMLKEGEGGEKEEMALKGCGMIREVLEKGSGREEGESREDESSVNKAEASSPVASDEGSPLTDEELMRELVGDFSSP